MFFLRWILLYFTYRQQSRKSESSRKISASGTFRIHSLNFGHFSLSIISDGNRTEWSPIRSVIILVITKSDDSAAGVQFVYHEYDDRPN